MKDENKYNDELSMSELDERICKAIDKLDKLFGNLNYVICGSISLYIQGIDLGRIPHDFDIFIPKEKNRHRLMKYFHSIYIRSGFVLDFPFRPLEGKEEVIEIIFFGKTIKCQTPKNILECKEYIVQNHLYYDKGEKKQQDDIEKLKLILHI